ncbi:hypothetical protein CH369_18025 [Leptospira levettii]|uniref:hypothetical protein n=1 Tax=Leptospira levettii TaxID=2023178 RepID=UPI000C29E8D9|nr:hypothetical protein [Leptospira levettii]PJZ98863.1 hypothetical protein CH369_18025 [Leptospira levettii]
MASSDINAYFKQIYGDAVSLVPEFAIVQKKYKFAPTDKRNGKEFVFPIKINHTNSITYASPESGTFNLEPLNGISTKSVSVKGFNIMIRDAISNEDLERGKTSIQSFTNSTSLVVKSIIESGAHVVEQQMLYGGTTLGVIDSSTNASSTETILQFTSGSWASGLWAGGTGKNLELYDTSDASKVTGVDYVTIVSVDNDNKRIRVRATAPEISALDTYLTSNDAHVYVKGAKGNSMAGINKILTNTGELFGVDASVVDLWRASTYNVSGAISIDKIHEAIEKALSRGCMESMDLYINPRAFTKLIAGQSELVRYDSSYNSKEAKTGFESLRINSANGMTTVYSHPMVKESDGFLLPPKQVKVIGATDWTWEKGTDEQYFFPLSEKAGKELRAFYNGAVLLQNPSLAVKLTGITY